MLTRLLLLLANLLLPPLAVMLIAGVGPDALFNTLLLLCGVLPAHVHGFYLSATYLHRRRRVRSGRWPGKQDKPLIWSGEVLRGGASCEEVRYLEGREWRERERERERRRRKGRRR